MLILAALAAAAACQPDVSRRELPPLARTPAALTPKGWKQESLKRFDLNGDGAQDVVVVNFNEDAGRRRMVAAVATPAGLRNVGEAELPVGPFGEPSVEFNDRKVLVVTDLTGGTTADQTVRRYRYEGPDARTGAMRYIGLDIGHYSRTYAHDGLDLSYNWLTGAFQRQVTRVDKDKDILAPQKPYREQRQARCYFMEDTKDPEEFVDAETPAAFPNRR